MRALVIITSTYPHGVGEDFIAAELPHLLATFDRVLLVPLGDGGAPHTRQNPAGVEMVDWKQSAPSPAGIRAAAGAAARMLPRCATVRHAPREIAWAASSGLQVAAIEAALRELLPEAEAVVFYGYWLMRHAAIAAELSRRWGPQARAAARAHGSDVFPSATGFLPGRRYLAQHLDHIFPISAAGARELYRQGVANERITVARLGVSAATELHQSQRLGEPWVITSCSNAAPVKQLPLMARTIAALHAEGQAVRWHHIGDTSHADFSLAEEISQLGISDVVTLHGRLPNPQVRPTLREIGAHVFLNTSASEGIPVTIMEALSIGLPVVAPDVGGISELVDDQCGALIEPRDPQQIAAAIRTVLSDDAAYHARSQAAYQRWQALADESRNYPEFAAQLRALLD